MENPPLFQEGIAEGEGERMPGSMKNDDAALVKEMKSGPPRKKKVETAGGVENRRVVKAGWIQGLPGGEKGANSKCQE